MQPDLPLRDVHAGVTPAWWPPAPGWWIVFAAALLLVTVLAVWWQRRRRRQRAIADLFEQAVSAAATPAEQVAAISALLRRAARRRNPQADQLQGDVWLAFLDGEDNGRPFTTGPGKLLIDGAFRPDVSATAASALRDLARQRYMQWMRGA